MSRDAFYGLFCALVAVVLVVALAFDVDDRLDPVESRLDRLETPTTLKAQQTRPASGASQRIERLPDGTVCIVVNGVEVETGRVEASQSGKPRCKP